MVYFKTMEFARYSVLALFFRSKRRVVTVGLFELGQTGSGLPLFEQHGAETKLGAGQVKARLLIGWILAGQPFGNRHGLAENFRGAREIAQVFAHAKTEHVAGMPVGNHELPLIDHVLRLIVSHALPHPDQAPVGGCRRVKISALRLEDAEVADGIGQTDEDVRRRWAGARRAPARWQARTGR